MSAELRRIAFDMPLTIIFGLALGGLLVPFGNLIGDELSELYDDAFPVVEMSTTLVVAANGEAVIAMSGKKNRDCTYVGIRAYSLDRDGNMSDAHITRTDGITESGTRPVGSFIVGTWRIWPIPDSSGISVYANHLCGSRMVLTKIAGLTIPKGSKQ